MGGEGEGKVKRKEGRRKEEEEDAHRQRWGLIFFRVRPEDVSLGVFKPRGFARGGLLKQGKLIKIN